jgi:hopanoid biosynthesis associated RND transporter like protein HpnN
MQCAFGATRVREMLSSSIGRLVDFCIRRPWTVVVLAIALTAGAGVYTARHFAINTDVHALISSDVPWARRALDYLKDFPQKDILVVLSAPTPEAADRAAADLAHALEARPDRFRAVGRPGSGSFFEQNGLLFLQTADVKRLSEGLIRADPLIGTLAADPSLRGALDALSLVLVGVRRGETRLDDVVRAMSMAAEVADASLAGRPTSFSWRVLMSDRPAEPHDLRRFLLIEPVLDFDGVQPGRAATEEIARIASDLKLHDEHQVRVRLTGRIPIDDDEFGTVKENAGLNATLTLAAVTIILWLALRSFRIIFAVAASLLAGLVISTAAGLLVVGALNVISVAFFVLFVGLGVDFGIQFSVRYRAERHDNPDLCAALRSTARKAGGPLALAAVATAVGFSSFLPTDYRGLSELGQIAGLGMIIAFITSITLLPALLAILNPRGEPHAMGFARLAPVDRFLERHRVSVVTITILAVVLASPLLLFLPFDFNPLHLRSTKAESVATYLELRSDPLAGAKAVEIVTPDLEAAKAMAQRISALPQVAQAKTLADLVPGDQDEKLRLIRAGAAGIDPSLNPGELQPPSTDRDTIEALSATATDLAKVAGDEQGVGPDAARRLSRLLTRLAEGDPAMRARADAAIAEPLRFSLDQLRGQLQAQPVSIASMPPDLAREWTTPDGRVRVEVLPKGDPDDTNTLREFVSAVLTVEPTATGPAVELLEAGNTVVRAFIQAGAFALFSIFVLLWITLRRLGDVLLTLVPLLVAGVVTLELCVVLDLPLNFANIIALPLLLGVGVAFKIYYIVAWRAGKSALLQSSLTRAVLFSGMTTATAFGSLWLSSHPGTSSMGKLMALALVCTMAAAVLFQPALMGPPRKKA